MIYAISLWPTKEPPKTMNTINNITENFGTLYYPKIRFDFYEAKGTDTVTYVEHFDMDSNGNPINAHPLTG